ncbi:MAG: enoyl-CoA hydratase/isomerase family protein [Deltaproteobacteria bacterium]|nr:enoyl-CoA hydratase/isomerase family protein [Deltaproteobacteria bacterium]
MEETVKLEKSSGIALVTLNRPRAYNSFSRDLLELFCHTITGLAVDADTAGIVISGEGKAFCTGGDLRWISEYDGSHGAAFHELAAIFHQAVLEMRHMPKPVVAAINGVAAGGGFSLALACDFRIMEASALLKQAYSSSGLSIDGGGTYSLPRLVGMARALEIAAFDEPLSSEKAKEWGLVTEVVKDGESVKRAVEMIEGMKAMSLSSFAASKRLINDSYNTPLEVQLEKERELLSLCGDSPNGREGIAAFIGKRKPVFKP